MKIRTRINLTFFLQFILLIIIVGIIIGYFSFSQMTKEKINLLVVAADSRAAHLETYFEDNIEELKLILSRTQLLNNINNYNSNKSEKIKKDIVKIITDAKNSIDEIESIYFINLSGKIEASTDEVYAGQDFIDWNRISDEPDKDHVFFGKKEGKDYLFFSGPFILNEKNIGIGVMMIKLDELTEIIHDNVGLGQTGEVLIAYKDVSEKRAYPITRRFESDSLLNSQENELVAQPMKEAINGVEKIFTSTFDYRNVKVIAVSKYVDSAKLGLVAKIDQSEAYADSFYLLYIILVTVIVFIFIFLLISIILSRKITQPIEKLNQAIDIVKNGNLDFKVDLKRQDEIGELSESFDEMTQAIKKSQSDIEIKVSEQTKEINEKAKFLADQRLAILNILEDVQEEKVNSEKLASIVRSAEEPIISKDLNGNITSWNRGAENLYGFTSQEILGKSIKIIVPADHYQEVDDFLAEVSKGKNLDHFQTVRMKKDGTLVDVSISISPIKDLNGKVIGASTIAMDITKEKAIDKAKTEFVSLASHQLRTPLSAINWYTEMLLAGDAGKINEEQKNYLDEIYRGNQRMVDLVNALLNVSRIDLGTFAIEPQPTQIIDLSKSVVNELKQQIESKKLKIKEVYDSTLPLMNVDPKLIRIIFQNLLSNAVKYTPDKGEVSVSIQKQKKEALIKVTDTGYGIPQGQQDKIFQKLFRADNVREKDTEGTGLGLYVVKSIVDQSNGKIWFESAENKGTTFYVSIPLVGMTKKEGTKELS